MNILKTFIFDLICIVGLTPCINQSIKFILLHFIVHVRSGVCVAIQQCKFIDQSV
jgi:hypothetical protein